MATVLRKGDTGEGVAKLQKALKEKKYLEGSVDGWFGNDTEKALKALQKDNGLVVDGIAGAATYALLYDGTVDPRFLTEADIKVAAKELGISPSVVKSIVRVETRGRGFLKNGKVKILFERHWMYKLVKRKKILSATEIEKLLNTHPFVFNPKSGGYKGGAQEHRRLGIAKGIDASSAIESASWGRFQIMGFWWKDLGYDSAVQFENLMTESESEHIKAFVRFVKYNPELLQAMRDLDWHKVARIYNGPKYKANKYAIKLNDAYEHFERLA